MRVSRSERGFSLAEALIVVAIMGLIILIAIPMLTKMLQDYNASTAARTLATHMRFARNACVSRKIGYAITIAQVPLDQDTATNAADYKNSYLMKYDPDKNNTIDTDVPNIDTKSSIPTGVRIMEDAAAASLFSSGDTVTLTFNKMGGVSPSGYLTFQSQTGQQFRITISPAGAVEVTRL